MHELYEIRVGDLCKSMNKYLKLCEGGYEISPSELRNKVEERIGAQAPRPDLPGDTTGVDTIRQAFGIEGPKAAPVLVRCCDGASFIADAIGDGLGIGRCAVDGEGSRPVGRWKVRPALWARGERRCGDYRGVAI